MSILSTLIGAPLRCAVLAGFVGLMLQLAGCQRSGTSVAEAAAANEPASNNAERSESSPSPAASAEPAANGESADGESTPTSDTEKPSTDSKPSEDAGSDGETADKPPDGETADEGEEKEPENPFPHRVPAPSLSSGTDWINVAGPIDLEDLRGKFVVLDFWTYCCINCMHLLPELKKLEQAYPNELVVIGVHSAKFETEQDAQNIEEAVLRYEIEHPVVNDPNHMIWNRYGAQSWPTLIVIDPEGYVVARDSGEVPFEAFDGFFKTYIPYYKERGLIDETPLRFDLARFSAEPTPLRFPGKVLADEAGDRLFIADSNHNRIVVTQLDGTLLETIGSGRIGEADGDFTSAEFDHPQGMALEGNVLYVADTENHLIRKVDLDAKQVTTIAGTGRQGHGWPGLTRDEVGQPVLPDRWAGPALETPLNSPWALWVHDTFLYIAMAGPHQIWRMPLDETEVEIYAGNGREDIVDGPLLPQTPYEQGYASFAQPSGLSSDGERLFVADSEGSSIRAMPFDPEGEVETVIGTSHLPGGRLFAFGDVDGKAPDARLQHALEVVYHDGLLYVADTYNNKIKVIDPEALTSTTLAGTGKPGHADDPATFDEPAGLALAAGKLYVADTNNHRIRTIELSGDHRVSTLEIPGLEPPAVDEGSRKPTFPDAEEIKLEPVTVKPTGGKIQLAVHLELPEGYKINKVAPMISTVEFDGEDIAMPAGFFESSRSADNAVMDFTIDTPLNTDASDEATLKVSLGFYYCKLGSEAVCKADSVVWTVPLTIADGAETSEVPLEYRLTVEGE